MAQSDLSASYAKWDEFVKESADVEEEQQGSMAAAVGKAEQVPFNGEVLLSEEEQRVIRRLPRRDKALWQVVVRPLRAWSASSQSPADGEAIPVRPRCVFVNELYPSGASLLRDLCDPPEREPAPRALLDRILSVMREPPEGLAQCRPAAVVLPDARVVAALGSSLAAVGVACAQLSESDGLQPLVREFSSFLVRKDIAAAGPSADHAGALSGTHVLPSLLYCFHRAAAAYRRLEPWRRLPPGAAFQLTVPHSRSVHVDDMPFRRASQGSIKARDTEIGEGRVDADAVGSGGGGSGDGHGVSAAATPEMVLRAPEGTVWVSIMGAPDPTPAEAARRASERAGTATEGEGTMQDRSPASPAGLALFFGQPALYERMLPGLVPARDPHACCAHTGAFAAEGSLPDEGGESLIPSLRQRGQGATPEAAAGSLSAPEEGGAGTGAAFPLPPSSGLQRCARCRAAYYRAAGDQRAHWRAHKRHCAESVRRFSPGGKPLGKGERAGVTWPDREVSVLFEPLTQVPFDDLDAAERYALPLASSDGRVAAFPVARAHVKGSAQRATALDLLWATRALWTVVAALRSPALAAVAEGPAVAARVSVRMAGWPGSQHPQSSLRGDVLAPYGGAPAVGESELMGALSPELRDVGDPVFVRHIRVVGTAPEGEEEKE